MHPNTVQLLSVTMTDSIKWFEAIPGEQLCIRVIRAEMPQYPL